MLHAFSPYSRTAASTRARVTEWIDYLGLPAKIHTYADLADNRPARIFRSPAKVASAELKLRRRARPLDRVLISREASPLSTGRLESRLLSAASHGVYDFDDALFHDPSLLRRGLGQSNKCRRAVAAADVVVAGSDYLADWASNHSQHVRVIPTCIDPAAYEPKVRWDITGEVPRIVWLGSTATEHYLEQIAPALAEVHRRTGAVVVLIGGDVEDRDRPTLRPFTRRVRWTAESFAMHLSTADLAVAPLDDSAYSRGKCAYKILQYAATGLPIVGSPVGANATALARLGGLAARGTDEWVDALESVVNAAEDRRRAMGQFALAAVADAYSFQARSAAWQEEVAWQGAT